MDSRKAMRNPAFKREVEATNGTQCVNCGSAEAIEYHHIVPLLLGGTNNVTNIVPLCHKCHEAAHSGRHISHYQNKKNSGRKPNMDSEKAYAIFDMYVGGEIGNRRCKELFGFSDRTDIKRRSQFKAYLKERGIKDIRNNVDIVGVNSTGRLKAGCPVGEIEYIDGRRELIYFKDTGANAVEYKQREIHESFPIWKQTG